MKENRNFGKSFPNKRISIEEGIHLMAPPTITRHTSMVYGAQFDSKLPIFKRNKSSEFSLIASVKKDDIFEFVFRFLSNLASDSVFLEKVLTELQYEKDSENISVTRISKSSQSQQSSYSNPSRKENESQTEEQQKESCNKELSHEKITPKLKNQNRHKISILCAEGGLSDFSCSSFWSSESLLNISTIDFPTCILTEVTIRQIFEEPEPFLINLSLCLTLKFLYYSNMKLNFENAAWIISIGTIIAYKIYYDEPVEGLMSSFSQILEMGIPELKRLERFFLETISFQAVITNIQYHAILSKVLQS